MLKFQTILHPTDFSPSSKMAFEVACSLARDHDARLILLHVQEQPLIIHSGVMMAPPPEIEDNRSALQEELARLQPSEPNLHIERRLEEGDPVRVILAVAQESGCDLIVMGTHGRKGLGWLLMGSVTEKVLRRASCPVLTVKISPADSPTSKESVSETSGSTL